MKNISSRFGLATLLLANAMPQLSLAQQTPVLSEVVVTATRAAIPWTDVLADVSIIDRDQIERSGVTSFAEVLKRLPGVSLHQSGGPASSTSLYMRGAESRYTAVFIDGVRIDSQSTGGATWEAIPLSQIERVEVLRGPAAAVYGADAIAGVVQIFTRQGEAGFKPAISLGMGTYGTREANVSLRGGQGELTYSLGLAHTQSDGFNAKPAGNPDLDGYRNRSFSGRLTWKALADHQLELLFLGNSQTSGYDSSATKNDLNIRSLQTLGLNLVSTQSDSWNTKLAITKGTDRYETTPSVYLTETQVSTYLVHNEFRLGADVLTADLERREDALQNSSTRPSAFTSRSQNALALGYGRSAGLHSWQVNARHDQDSEFGGNSTGALAYGYALTPALRASASLGTAFRAPTLYQRFSIYGTSTLKAETSKNQELGLRWLSGVHRLGAVFYRNEVDNLISYISGSGSCINGSGSDPGCYGNTGRALMTGTTLTGQTLWGNINLGASLDLMDPKNRDTGKRLTRRPRTESKLTVDMPVDDWRWGGELLYAGERFDNSANTTRLAPYSLVNLTASKPLDRDWRVLARVNNLSDKNYVLANGYATPGRNFFIGLSWSPKS